MPVFIEIDSDDHNICGQCCPFNIDDECCLFNIILEDTKLKPGFVWNECHPTKQRHYRCHGLYTNITNKKEEKIMKIKNEITLNEKLKITCEHIHGWMDDNWIDYCSQMFKGELLKLSINGNAIYQITHGEKNLYRGNDREFAVNIWNNFFLHELLT